jgi:DMSO/TMAO reductase YedYZ molybdopterin-dependent catalytic subunit
MDLVEPQPGARWVVFYSLGEGPDKGVDCDVHHIEHELPLDDVGPRHG